MRNSAVGEKKRRKLTQRVQFKFMLAFFTLIVALLAVMDTYPIIASRDLVFSEKQSSLTGQTAVIAASLSSLDTLTSDSVGQVMSLLDVAGLERIVVTDASARTVYDSASTSEVGKYALLSEISLALEGESVFWSRFGDGVFTSRAALPVYSGAGLSGAVYICELDTAQAELILSVQSRLWMISLVCLMAAMALTVVFSRALTARITRLAQAMRVVRGGDYEHRIKPEGNDELTELSEEFNDMTERLQATEAERRRFVSDASHELKTPLAAIRLLADSIIQSSDMDEATMREFVADIGSEAERLQRTSEKLLDLSRRDAGAPRDIERVDLGEAAAATSRLIEPLAADMSVSVSCEAEEGCFVLASEDELYRIVFNLAENAVKYNVEGGEVKISAARRGARVVLAVEDTGIGIPEEDMPHIFERFYRVDKARSREKGGSGLGLSIVHDAVVSLGGEIDVAARPERGTRFTVSFPAAPEEDGGGSV